MRRKEEKKRQIMDIATNLFITRGFHGTPTSLIAKEANIATGTLFNYFKTKDILVNEIFIEIIQNQKIAILKGVEEADSFREKLKKVWDNLIIWSIEFDSYHKFLHSFRHSYVITEGTKQELMKNYKFLFLLFKGYVEKKQMQEANGEMLLLNFIGSCLFTKKYFEIMDEKYNKKISRASFNRFCKGISLTEEL